MSCHNCRLPFPESGKQCCLIIEVQVTTPVEPVDFLAWITAQ
jgi:hypothetical protein